MVQDAAIPRQRLPLPAKRMHKVSGATSLGAQLSVALPGSFQPGCEALSLLAAVGEPAAVDAASRRGL